MDDYEADEDDEISFPEGAVVDVMQKRLSGWWLVKYEDQIGLAPGTFLRKAKNEMAMVNHHSKTNAYIFDQL